MIPAIPQMYCKHLAQCKLTLSQSRPDLPIIAIFIKKAIYGNYVQLFFYSMHFY